jgi:hypothetical protein
MYNRPKVADVPSGYGFDCIPYHANLGKKKLTWMGDKKASTEFQRGTSSKAATQTVRQDKIKNLVTN